MKVLLVSFLASAGFGASLPRTLVHGDYVEARTADVYTGPCFGNSEAGLVGELAVFGWHIRQGTFEGVKLDGLSVAAAVKASNTLGDRGLEFYPVKAVLIVDEKAGPEQRLALRKFAQRASGDLLQEIVRVEYRPISLAFENDDLHAARATLVAGELARIETRALSAIDHICGNEEIWYHPLVKVGHAMPAVALEHNFRGQGLGTIWSSPDKRSAFVASFQYAE